MSTEDIKVNKNSEFFITLATKGIHSFLMLGVILEDGSPKILARVAKGAFGKYYKNLGSIICGNGALAYLLDEGVSRRPTVTQAIHHQSYSLNYAQAQECLGLIYDTEKRQLDTLESKKAMVRDKVSRRLKKIEKDISAKLNDLKPHHHQQQEEQEEQEELLGLIKAIDSGDQEIVTSPLFISILTNNISRIKAYVPTAETGDEITFSYKLLADRFKTQERPAPKEEVVSRVFSTVSKIQFSNTCRRTSLNMVEVILGFKTHISEYFFIKPKYETTLVGGNPQKDSFYILPPPPTSYKTLSLSKHQMLVLNKLYKRLEDLPMHYATNIKTKQKFDQLKKMYDKIAGQNNLDANDLLAEIGQHLSTNNAVIYARRSTHFLAELWSNFFAPKTTTEVMFDNIKKELDEVSTDKKPPK